MERMLSGIKPTGKLTLGNYIGAILNFVKLQEEYEMIVFIANLHAITINIDSKELKENTRDIAALYLACGLDPNRAIIFNQSEVMEHAYLGYVLACNSYMGELSRMTQFKDKTSKVKNESIPTGLFIYPTLMASDILIYDPKYVPVGEDQKQHVELTRDLAIRFNNKYGETFTVPTPVMAKQGAKIKSLTDPNKKMSKSEVDGDKGCIYLLDDLNVARKKIMGAVTDSENKVRYDVINKPGISNLMTIYSCLTNKSLEEIENEFLDGGYGNFKRAVADAVCMTLENIQTKYHEVINSGMLDEVLTNGANKARELASKKMKEVEEKVGFVRC